MLGIYVRLSKEDESNNSIANQLREGKQFAKANGYRQYEIYNEGQGISGGNEIKDRPQLDRMMKDIASKRLGAVWFRHQNRLERNSVTFHLFSALAKKMEIEVFFGDNKADLNDPTQFLQASIMTAINAYQIEMQTAQIRRTLLDNAKEGKATGGNHIPYGYRTDDNKYLVIDEETSKIVELIFKRCIEGVGGGRIAKELNEMGVPTKNGALVWKQPTIHSILKNPAYMGQKRFGDKHYPIPAILDQELWRKAQKQLKHNVTYKGKRVEHKYLLKHLVKCGRCGKTVHILNYDKNIRYYRCSSVRNGDNCHNPYFRVDALENLVWGLFEFNNLYEGVESHLTGERNDEKLLELDERKDILEKELSQLDGQLQRTIQLVIKEIVSEEEIVKTRKTVQSQKERIEKEIENIDDQIDTIKNLDILREEAKKDLSKLKGTPLEKIMEMVLKTTDKAEKLESVSFNEKRELIKKYIQSIEIKGTDDMFLIHIEYALPIPDSFLYVSKNYEVVVDANTDQYINFDLLGLNEEYQDRDKKAITKLILRYT